MQEYEHLYFNEDIHISTVFNCTAVRQRFLKELRHFPVEKLHLDPGSGIGATIFIISKKSFSSRDDDKCYKMYKPTHITREQDTRIPHKLLAAEFFETVFYSI